MRPLSTVAVALLAFVCLACLVTPAAADRSIDVALLRPTGDGQGLVTLERAQTPMRWEVGASLLLCYANAPLQLSLLNADGKTHSAHNLIEDQFTLDVGLSLGLWDFLVLGATLPVAAQSYDDQAVGQLSIPSPGAPGITPLPTVSTGIYRNQPRENIGLSAAGPRDPRLLLKGRLYHNDRFGLALMLSATFPMGNSSSFLGDKDITVRPVLIGDLAFGRLALLGNLGFIFRSESDFNDPPGGPTIFSVGHELTWALGASVRATPLLGASLEAFGTVPLVGPQSFTEADLLGAAYVYPTSGIRILVGVGGGLAVGSPLRDPVRVVAGLSFSPSPPKVGLR